MSVQDKAYDILTTAREVFDSTGWCQGRLLSEEGSRCLNGALTLGILTHCELSDQIPLAESESLDDVYPEFFESVVDETDWAAVMTSLRNLAQVVYERVGGCKWDPDNTYVLQSIIWRGNDSLCTQRRDVLEWLDKAIANT